MAKFNYLKNRFIAGELTPKLLGRSDLPSYASGAQIIENFHVLVHGGIKRRPGMRFVARAKTADKRVRLIPFVYSTTVAYVLEFGNNYIRFYKDRALLTKTYAAWLTTTAYVIGDLVTNSGNHYRCLVAHTSGTFATDLAAGKWAATAGATDTAYEIPTTYLEAELPDIAVVQEATTMYIAHNAHAPATLTRSSDTSWALADISFTSAPAAWGTGNYPGAVTMFEQRLIFANAPSNPQTVWMSKNGTKTDFTTGTADDNSIAVTVFTDRMAAILHLMTTKLITALTYGAEMTIAGNSDAALTPTNIQIRTATSHGCSFVKPFKIGSEIFFTQRSKQKLRTMVYDYATDNYVATDITELSDHIAGSGFKEFAYAQEPYSLIWGCTVTGQIVSCAYNKAQNIQGWSRHTTQGQVESICTIPSGAEDQVWLAVRRGDIRTIEYFDETLNTDCAVTGQDDNGIAELSGLGHLEGQTVDLVADGGLIMQPQKVSNGKVVLQRNVTSIEAGLHYDSTVIDMPVETATQQGSAFGSAVSVHEIKVRLYQSQGCTVNGETLPFRKFGEQRFDSSAPLFTGDKTIANIGGWHDMGVVTVQQTMPLPCTVLTITKKVSIND